MAPFTLISIQLNNKDIDTNETEVFNIETGKFSKEQQKGCTHDETTKLASFLYVKDKFAIADKAYHELSQLTSYLPHMHDLKKLAKCYYDESVIIPTPNEIVGVQQSLQERLKIRLHQMHYD